MHMYKGEHVNIVIHITEGGNATVLCIQAIKEEDKQVKWNADEFYAVLLIDSLWL